MFVLQTRNQFVKTDHKEQKQDRHLNTQQNIQVKAKPSNDEEFFCLLQFGCQFAARP